MNYVERVQCLRAPFLLVFCVTHSLVYVRVWYVRSPTLSPSHGPRDRTQEKRSGGVKLKGEISFCQMTRAKKATEAAFEYEITNRVLVEEIIHSRGHK